MSTSSFVSRQYAFAKYDTVVVIVIIDGLYKPHYPGSLREPATTYLFPENWLAVPLAYGLLASPWGAHSVFPSVSYTDAKSN